MGAISNVFSYIKNKWVLGGIGVVIVVFLIMLSGGKDNETLQTYIVTSQDVKEAVLLSGRSESPE